MILYGKNKVEEPDVQDETLPVVPDETPPVNPQEPESEASADPVGPVAEDTKPQQEPLADTVGQEAANAAPAEAIAEPVGTDDEVDLDLDAVANPILENEEDGDETE